VKTLFKTSLAILFAIFSINICSASNGESESPISLCAQIDTGAITNVLDGSKVKYSKDISFILFTRDANGANYTIGDGRATIGGHVYISNDSVLKLKTLTVATMDNDKPTDFVTQIVKNNKFISGMFYNSISSNAGDPDKVIYIAVDGDVYHLKTYSPKDNECLGHFPENFLKSLSSE
jgi:hypothetical protein